MGRDAKTEEERTSNLGKYRIEERNEGGRERKIGLTSLKERDIQKQKAKRGGDELDPRQGLALGRQKPEESYSYLLRLCYSLWSLHPYLFPPFSVSPQLSHCDKYLCPFTT